MYFPDIEVYDRFFQRYLYFRVDGIKVLCKIVLRGKQTKIVKAVA